MNTAKLFVALACALSLVGCDKNTQYQQIEIPDSLISAQEHYDTVNCAADSAISTPPRDEAHPNMYLNAYEINAIKQKIAEGAEPWLTSYQKLIENADKALELPLKSVRTEGKTTAEYYTEAPYAGWSDEPNRPKGCPRGSDICDGHANPNADRKDFSAIGQMGRAVRDLGLAYVLSDKSVYAEKAKQILFHWAVDPKTAMAPRFTNRQSEIEISITVPAMFYGADLIYTYPDWRPFEKDAFIDWVKTFAANVKARDSGYDVNNFGDWRLVLLATAGALTKDKELLEYVYEHYRGMLAYQISPKGEFLKELDRTKSLSYSTYAANAILQVCEVARHQGVDLYGYAAENGSGSIEKSLDYLAPFVLGESEWPHEQVSDLKPHELSAFELAWFAYEKDIFDRAASLKGRPVNEIRVLGLITLSHYPGAFPASFEFGCHQDTTKISANTINHTTK